MPPSMGHSARDRLEAMLEENQFKTMCSIERSNSRSSKKNKSIKNCKKNKEKSDETYFVKKRQTKSKISNNFSSLNFPVTNTITNVNMLPYQKQIVDVEHKFKNPIYNSFQQYFLFFFFNFVFKVIMECILLSQTC